MENTNALTPPQNLLVLAIPLALMGFVFWLSFRGLDDPLAEARDKVRAQQKVIDQLRQREEEPRRESGRQREDEERAKLEENTRMFLREDGLLDFVASLLADAEGAAVTIRRIEYDEPVEEDYYEIIPITVEVNGRARDVIDLFQTLESPRKPVVHVRRLTLHRPKASQYGMTDVLYDDESKVDEAARARRMREEEQSMTNEERRMLKLRRWQMTNERLPVRASFRVYAFAYTGQPVGAAGLRPGRSGGGGPAAGEPRAEGPVEDDSRRDATAASQEEEAPANPRWEVIEHHFRRYSRRPIHSQKDIFLSRLDLFVERPEVDSP